MEYYSEYTDAMKPNEFHVRNSDIIELKQSRILFDNYRLHCEQTGRILANTTGQRIIQWRLNYNCFTLLRENLKSIFLELDTKGEQKI